MLTKVFAGVGIAVAMAGCVDEAQTEVETTDELLRNNGFIPSGVPVINAVGYTTTISTAPGGRIDLNNEFFQDLGANGRRCVSCHLPTAGWGITPKQMQVMFDLTDGGAIDDGFGLGAVFRTNDGSNSPTAQVTTLEERRAAYSMLLTRGTIRVGIGIPAGGELELITAEDPYGHASAAELSLFRRPLPSTNLTLIAQVMWDGRVAAGNVHDSLAAQSNGATQGHAEAPEPISDEARQSIVNFETTIFTGQVLTHGPGNLTSEGATGGAQALTTLAVNRTRFNMFDAWKNSTKEARKAVYRGQELFNTRQRPGAAPPVPGSTLPIGTTCNFCHSASNSGTSATGAFFTVGASDAVNRKADQPLYTIKCTVPSTTPGGPAVVTTVKTTDPGRALITGKCVDMNKFKVPSLRALGARAPYFHGGSANTLPELVKFYETSLGFNFNPKEEADLVAFLNAL